jgi:N-formylglutamate amidohydrolase
MANTSFDLSLPSERTTSVIFASPHSGRNYPWSLLRRSVLDEHAIRSSEDAFVDQLFDSAPLYGAPFLIAKTPRAFVDLNRAKDELDPALIENLTTSVHNARIASGLGVIPRVVANGRAIYSGKITQKEAESRLNEIWHPYHTTLTNLVKQSLTQFSEAILIDCHSMPNEAIDAFAKGGARKPDVVLGDRFGASASPAVMNLVEQAFERQGFRVSRNAPFSGAYIVQHYGRPSVRQHAIQVEIDRALYMNETLIRPNGNFKSCKTRLERVIAELALIGRQGAVPLAAE